MDKLIARIMEIEEAAQSLAREAEASFADFDRELRDEIEELRQTISAQAEEQIARLREREESGGHMRIQAQNTAHEAQRAALLDNKERHIGQWMDAIFADVVDTSS